jgi:hypothetical protein
MSVAAATATATVASAATILVAVGMCVVNVAVGDFLRRGGTHISDGDVEGQCLAG